MPVTEAEAANVTRWNGEPGRYEVYYLKFNHLRTSTGFWIRYTLLAPVSGSPVAELWAIFFDAKDPSNNRAVKNTFPVSQAVIKKDSFSFGIGNALIEQTRAYGGIRGKEGSITWDLRFEPVFRIFRHFPYGFMYRASVPKTKVISPNFSMKVYGSVEVNGRTFDCNGEPGQQTHLWGTKHAERWTWANSSIFKEDSSAIFEGLSAQIKIGNRTSPALTLFFIRCLGKDYYLNGLFRLFRNKSESAFPVWKFGSEQGKMRFMGEISAAMESFAGVEYTDPDGEKLWCYNTKVANLVLEVYEGSTRLAKLTSPGVTALEFVSRYKDPRVSIRI